MERSEKMKKWKLSPMQKATVEFFALCVVCFVCCWLSVIVMQGGFVWFWGMPSIVTNIVTFFSVSLSAFWVYFSHICGHYNNKE